MLKTKPTTTRTMPMKKAPRVGHSVILARLVLADRRRGRRAPSGIGPPACTGSGELSDGPLAPFALAISLLALHAQSHSMRTTPKDIRISAAAVFNVVLILVCLRGSIWAEVVAADATACSRSARRSEYRAILIPDNHVAQDPRSVYTCFLDTFSYTSAVAVPCTVRSIDADATNAGAPCPCQCVQRQARARGRAAPRASLYPCFVCDVRPRPLQPRVTARSLGLGALAAARH